MNLDFLDVLSQHDQENVGTVRTERTGSMHAGFPVPDPVVAVENHENQIPRPPVDAADGSQWFPSGSQAVVARKTNLFADVPKVLNKSEQAVWEQARVQVYRWTAARCTQSQRAWAAEKFLYIDYAEWCQRSHQSPIPRELFCAAVNGFFYREGEGWQGLCLAVDTMASERTM